MWHNHPQGFDVTEGGVLYLVFCPKTFLQCFALECKAKHCRNGLGTRPRTKQDRRYSDPKARNG